MKEYRRLKDNLCILGEHNQRNISVLQLTNFVKTEKEVINDIFEDIKNILDKIENGTLIELPCKEGDKVYNIYKPCSKCQHFKDYAYTDYIECALDDEKCMFEADFDIDCIYEIQETEFIYSMIDKFGKTIFLTKAEAEAKLKELNREV